MSMIMIGIGGEAILLLGVVFGGMFIGGLNNRFLIQRVESLRIIQLGCAILLAGATIVVPTLIVVI